MYSNNKQIRDVADVAARIMFGQQPVTEKLHSNQQKLDVHEPEKDELTADDFKKLRAGKKADVKKEEVEQIDEVKMADLPSTKVQGRAYGASKPEPHAVDTLRGPKEKELKDIEAEKKKKKFSEMVNLYQEKGLKSLSEMLVKEEPDNEQFTKELEDEKAKSEGKKPNKEIAKGAVQAVKSEEVETKAEVIEEREMTSAEMEKRETIVKSMKKGMAGFKERYGDRAKNVMYATATKQAMKEETESEHYKAGHEYASDHAQDAGFKVTARARKKEMLADNPHKKGTPEHSDWHRGANDGHQTALDNM